MTWFEFRAMLVLQLARLLRIKLSDLYDSYPYNPYSKAEVRELYFKAINKDWFKRDAS